MTSSDQLSRVRELIAQEGIADGDKPALTGWLQRVCRAAARDLPASGVGISLLSPGQHPLPVAASDPTTVLVEELQFVLGEGPCLDAYDLRSPVLVPDLSAASGRWPGYVHAAHAHGVRAVFALPLQVGAARLGAMDVYRAEAEGLTPDSLSRAVAFATVAMRGLLDGPTAGSDAVHLFDDSEGNRPEVHQAQGMVMAHLGISAEDALTRLRAHAYASDRRAIDVARDIIMRKLTLESDA